MKVSVLIVTYGDRFHFLKKVLERVCSSSPYEIILVDNASKNQLDIEKYFSTLINIKYKYIRFEKNTGSAGGFSAGLEYFLKTDSEIIILLDDDNLPDINFIDTYLKFLYIFPDKNVVLSGFRPQLKTKNEFYADTNEYNYTYYLSHFLFKKIVIFLSSFIKKRNFSIIRPSISFVYGGTMISKEIIKKIGLPRQDFFLYVDDIEWSHRISLKYPIYNLFHPQIEDLDKSNHNINRKYDFISNKKIDIFKIKIQAYNNYFFASSILHKNIFRLYIYLFFQFIKVLFYFLINQKLDCETLQRIIIYYKFSIFGILDKRSYNFNKRI